MTTQTTPPARTIEQRLESLKLANEIRTKRAATKKLMKRGQRDPRTVVNNLPEHMESMRAFDFLMSQAGIGKVKAERVLKHLGLRPAKQLGAMSERQRAELGLLAFDPSRRVR